ncbi:YwqG family protein [Streptomyces erythrochromogenes]|uniref:YwqG family protein n=1 Tax=Streptomyces erythrochromogenes TaxID=285574 RepID=UPI00367FCA39
MTHAPAEALHDLARRLLSPDDAARWIALLRPGLRLAHAGDGPVAGRLGGLPDLPLGMPWPAWEGHGPLSHIASLDCAALTAAGDSGLPLPASGTLLFFLFDGRLDDEDCMVYPSDPETRPGSRVLHVPAGTPTRRHPAPAELSPYPEVALTAQAGLSVPTSDAPNVRAAFGATGDSHAWRRHPVNARPFDSALRALDTHPSRSGHRLGGHPVPVQEPVEWEVARGVLGPDAAWQDSRLDDEAAEWVLLAQIDTDRAADMMWGDVGTAYWLIRPADLAAGRFEEAVFTWQCC